MRLTTATNIQNLQGRNAHVRELDSINALSKPNKPELNTANRFELVQFTFLVLKVYLNKFIV
jgi:hypothetical protein